MRNTLFFLALLMGGILAGCEKELPKIELLSGYWSITKVTHKSETFTPKSGTPLWDFYAVEGQQGFRKKIEPQIGNQKRTSEDASPFTIAIESGGYVLNFSTRWDRWQEKIIELTTEVLIIEHQEKRYHYKKEQTQPNGQ